MTAVLTSLATTFFRNAAVHPGSYCVSELTSFFTPWLKGGNPSLVMEGTLLTIYAVGAWFHKIAIKAGIGVVRERIWVKVPINCLLNHGHDVAGLNVGI